MVQIKVSLSFEGRKNELSSTIDSGSNKELTILETEDELKRQCKYLIRELRKLYKGYVKLEAIPSPGQDGSVEKII